MSNNKGGFREDGLDFNTGSFINLFDIPKIKI
jgi:hypothetical protein